MALTGTNEYGQTPAQQVRQQVQARFGSSGDLISTPEINRGLPENLKAGLESLSGINMGDVQVHYNSSRPAQLQAHAYTQGSAVHVAPGQEQFLPHEAWHVIQQRSGR